LLYETTINENGTQHVKKCVDKGYYADKELTRTKSAAFDPINKVFDAPANCFLAYGNCWRDCKAGFLPLLRVLYIKHILFWIIL